MSFHINRLRYPKFVSFHTSIHGGKISRLRSCNFRNLSVHKVTTQPIAGVSKDVSDLILNYANSSQTGISLQTLMKTGRGELIHKTYKEETSNKSSKVATDKILMQVAGMSYILILECGI